MKREARILTAFILNLFFSIFEFVGGALTGSVAIVSDAVHDLGDAASIGIAWLLEKKSMRRPDGEYTYGYARYSTIGGFITTAILLVGSAAVIYNAVGRIIDPAPINYDGMIIFAVVGVAVNLIAARVTHKSHSANEKAVNLHMLEDVLGWIVVLIGAVIMRFTDLYILDALMSVGVAVFITVNAVKNLISIVEIFLEKTPRGIDTDELTAHLTALEGVEEVHHLHVWSMDGENNYATLHAVTDGEPHTVKHLIRDELARHGIAHVTVELEYPGEHCHEKHCSAPHTAHSCHHHH